MQVLLDVTLPVFGLIGCGYAALRFGLLQPAGLRGLNDFVYFFALPALLLLKVADAPIGALIEPRFFLAYYTASAILLTGTIAMARYLFHASLATAGLQAMSVVWTNGGYLGIPLVIAAFGPDAALPIVFIMTIDALVVAPLVIAMIEAEGEGAVRCIGLRTVAGGLVRNPLILAVMIGLALNLGGLGLPAPLRASAELLGAAAGPCALFAIGASLVGVPLSELRSEVVLLSAVKLFMHPLLIAALVLWLVPLDPVLARITIIAAALPTGVNVYVLAQQYGVLERRSSTVLFLTHLGSVVTVSALLALLA